MTITLDTTWPEAVTANLSYGGTATSAVDYTAPGSITVTAGATIGQGTLSVSDDRLFEGIETISVAISSLTAGVEGTPNQQVINLTDNDPSPTVSLSQGSPSIGESGGSTTITAMLSAAAGVNVTATLAINGSSTADASDYLLSGTTIEILPGDTMGSVTVTGIDDALIEGSETLIVSLATVINATEVIAQEARVTINDADAGTLSIDDVAQAEGDSGATTFTFTVTADLQGNSATGSYTVDYTTADGSATLANGDYGSSSGSLTFAGADGETQKLTVEVSGDTVSETDETFAVNLSNLMAGGRALTIGDGAGLGTITNDETASIGDLVWNDLNANGAFDTGEPPIAGVTVFLDLNTNGTLDGGEPSAVTDAGGAYDFLNLSAGSYSVGVDASTLPESRAPSSSGPNPRVVAVAVDEDLDLVDFGFVLDVTPPEITSITRLTPATSPTNADSLVFQVVFSEPVVNVSQQSFVVSGGSTATITNVAGADDTYRLTVSGGDLADFEGEVGIELPTFTISKGFLVLPITDVARNVLNPSEPETDERYTLDNTPPVLESITIPAGVAATTNADVLILRLTFDGDAQNVQASDFRVSGGSTATVSALTPVTAETVFDVEVSGGDITTYAGPLGLDVALGQGIVDSAGNALDGSEPAIDEVYQLVVVEAAADAFAVAEGNVLGVASRNGLLANDSALDSSALTVVAIDGQPVVGADYAPAGGGIVNVATDGSLSFDAGGDFEALNEDETASVTFTYTASDGDTDATATVTITVTGRADMLTARDDAFTILEDRSITGNLLEDNGSGRDSGGEADEVLTVSPAGTFEASGIGGEVVVNADGSFGYTPPAARSARPLSNTPWRTIRT